VLVGREDRNRTSRIGLSVRRMATCVCDCWCRLCSGLRRGMRMRSGVAMMMMWAGGEAREGGERGWLREARETTGQTSRGNTSRVRLCLYCVGTVVSLCGCPPGKKEGHHHHHHQPPLPLLLCLLLDLDRGTISRAFEPFTSLVLRPPRQASHSLFHPLLIPKQALAQPT